MDGKCFRNVPLEAISRWTTFNGWPKEKRNGIKRAIKVKIKGGLRVWQVRGEGKAMNEFLSRNRMCWLKERGVGEGTRTSKENFVAKFATKANKLLHLWPKEPQTLPHPPSTQLTDICFGHIRSKIHSIVVFLFSVSNNFPYNFLKHFANISKMHFECVFPTFQNRYCCSSMSNSIHLFTPTNR